MIQSNELRLGNFVKTIIQVHPMFADKAESIVSIESISEDDCVCKSTIKIKGMVISNSLHRKNLSELDPIPLTEKILLKCGFRKKENKYTYEYVIQKYLILSCYKNHINDSDFCAYWNDCQMWDVMSVHQLQNLYFAITGKELEVKL